MGNNKLNNLIKEQKTLRQCLNVAKKEARASNASLYSFLSQTDALLTEHALEKGMGMAEVKKGFGKTKAMFLIDQLIELKKKDMTYCYAYQEGLSVLFEYLCFQKKSGVDVADIEARANEHNLFENYEHDSERAGYIVRTKEEMEKGKSFDFKDFAGSRHSVRAMSDEPVTEDEMVQAVSMAQTAPSACNRQPAKVYYSFDPKKNELLSRLVPGNRGFENTIPYYCVITADRGMFKNYEMFQWFVNGGIFVSFFILALHSLGIGSCVFQWTPGSEKEQELRDLAHIKDNEAIIAIVGYGKYLPEMKCLCAERKPVSEVLSEF